MEASTDYIRRHAGRSVSLQVKEDNPAVALYRELGFQSLGTVTRWQLSGHLRLGQIRIHNRRVIKARRHDWVAIWQLFQSVTLAAQGWPEPWPERDFRPGFWHWLSNLMAARSVVRWVVPTTEDGGLDGYVEYRVYLDGKRKAV